MDPIYSVSNINNFFETFHLHDQRLRQKIRNVNISRVNLMRKYIVSLDCLTDIYIWKETHCDHQRQRTPIDDETKSGYHEPSENSSDYPISPTTEG